MPKESFLCPLFGGDFFCMAPDPGICTYMLHMGSNKGCFPPKGTNMQAHGQAECPISGTALLHNIFITQSMDGKGTIGHGWG